MNPDFKPCLPTPEEWEEILNLARKNELKKELLRLQRNLEKANNQPVALTPLWRERINEFFGRNQKPFKLFTLRRSERGRNQSTVKLFKRSAA